MVDPELLAESRRLLDQARMIAEAPAAHTAEIARKRSRRRPAQGTSSAPPETWGFATSTLEACGERINRAIANDSDAQLAAANRWATREIDALQHSPAGGAETPGEFGDRIVAQHEGELAGVVARAEMTSVTTVRKLREERGRDPRTGKRVAGEGLAGGG
jgi:hypothetical protein